MLYIFGRTLDMIGKIMIAFTAIMVHHRFLQEHRVDEQVFRTMKREQRIAMIGVAFMVIGFILEMVSTVADI